MKREYIVIFLLIIIFVNFLLPLSQFSETVAWIYIAIGLLCAVLFFCVRECNNNIRKTFLRPSYLFVIAYLIVFFQRPADYMLGYVNGYIKVGEVRYMLMSLNYAVVGLCCFIIGYLIVSRKTTLLSSSGLSRISMVSPVIYAVLSSGLIILTIVLVPKEILLGGYSNDMLTNASIYNYFASWCNTILIAYIVQFTINAKQTKELEGCSFTQYFKNIGIWQNVNVILYAFIILNVGDRGPLIIVALSYYISYIILSNRTPSKVRIIIALCIGVVTLSILGDTKQYRKDNTIVDRLVMLYTNQRENQEPKSSFLPATEQLSGSYCCLPIALQMVPEYEDFRYGTYVVSDLVAGIPFVGRLFQMPPSTSYQISKYALGDDFNFGLGTNCIAALYMDGGLFFIMLGLFIWGIALRKFEICIFSRTMQSFFVFCMAFYFLTHVVYIPRSSLLSPFKYALWMYLVMTIFSFLPIRKGRTI